MSANGHCVQRCGEVRPPASRFRRFQIPGLGVAIGLLTIAGLGLAPRRVLPPAIAQTTPVAPAPNRPLDIGVVQRFGEDMSDTLTLTALGGDRLTVEFETGGQPQTLTATEIKIAIAPLTLPDPRIQEWVVLSSHRSFESAEDSAKQWQQRGIATDIAQPDGWEVWAKRDVYHTPLLRRLLLQDLQAQGYATVYLDSDVEPAIPKVGFIVNGMRYNRDRFRITSSYRQIRVQEGTNARNTKIYGGTLHVQPNAYGDYTLVNVVPMETYLRGVVPHEIGLGAPMPTIEAQAVLARTYALRNLRRFEIDGYELCADTQCQVYNGLGGAADKTDRAIQATAGMVLTYENELVDALYSSTTGGVTAPFEDVWNGPSRPYLQAVVDSVTGAWNLSQASLADEANFRAFISRDRGFNEEDWDTFRWERSGSLDEIAVGLREYLTNRQHPLANFRQILNLAVTRRAHSGRVQEVQVQTDIGVVTLEKDEVIRALIPPRSLLFYVVPVYESATQPPPPSASGVTPAAPPPPVLKGYLFKGGGFGHGVGMSQTGAYNLGALGWNYARILDFYYPGTQLQPFSDRLILWRDPAIAASPDPALSTNPSE